MAKSYLFVAQIIDANKKKKKLKDPCLVPRRDETPFYMAPT